MILKLNEKDRQKFNILMNTLAFNDTVVNLYSSYLNFTPRFITPELVKDVATGDGAAFDEYAVAALLCTALGIDSGAGKLEMAFFRNYIVPSVEQLDEKEYADDPYYKNIKIPTLKHKDWEFRYESYAPFELFVCNDPALCADHREIPQLGFFKKEFPFPAVLQNGREWMTVTPNEINTMKEPIKRAHGRVVTFGLGLGYFAYMVSEKPNVNEVAVIENDRDVIYLFEKYILPQFSYKDKIKIVCADAFEFAKSTLPCAGFDYAFVDLWLDASDGLSMYAEMRRLEALSPSTEFDYWIEASLLSHLRRMIAAELDGGEGRVLLSYDQITELLSNTFLREAVKDIKEQGAV